jgi:hypothetical protein
LDPFVYRPPFLKHLHNLVINGFYARDLDADDHEFLEYVKVHGIANGSLPSTNVVLLEELEFWNWPYTIAPDVERRIGPRSRPVATVEERAMRLARQRAWHARRVIRENEAAIAAAEMEREHREWEKVRKKRELRELLASVEWDAAAPGSKATFGKTVARHHVPQWKLDERRGKNRTGPSRSGKARKMRHERAIEAALLHEQAQAQERALEAQARASEALRLQEQALQQAHEQARARREKIIAEARKILEESQRLQRERQHAASASLYPTAESLTRAILALLNGSTPGFVWTQDRMMITLGCNDAELLERCLNELVRSGRLRKVSI